VYDPLRAHGGIRSKEKQREVTPWVNTNNT